jgi:glycosyltransferase involved in cell wall biosynthesis
VTNNISVLNISTYDEGGGAARAALRLHQGLSLQKIDSWILVQSKSTDYVKVIGPQSKIEKALEKFRLHLDRLPIQLYVKEPVSFSPAILPNQLNKKIASLNPDIVHLHWITGGFVPIEQLPHFHGPLVWTLHDSWAFTGGCHIPYDCQRYRQACGACPMLKSSREVDLSRWIWQRKHKAWKSLQLRVVAPSRWLGNSAKASSLFQSVPVEVIPNGLDLQQFKPTPQKLARDLWSLPIDKKVILFGAVNGINDRNKGFHLLTDALQKLVDQFGADHLQLLIFGASEPAVHPNWGVETRYVGRLYDEVSLATLYAAADVMVVPSVQEAFGQTAVEAMACGTPVVAFGATGLLDIVDHQQTGYLAIPYETSDLAQGIHWVLADDKRREGLGLQSRLKVEREFSLEKVTHQYITLYQELASIKN